MSVLFQTTAHLTTCHVASGNPVRLRERIFHN